MSLKKNIVANYASLIYTTAIGILILPVLHELLGREAFGLIGFYATLQFWFVLMDFGLSATLSRECSRYSGGILSESQLISTIKSIEFAFRVLAASGLAAVLLSADYISSSWLSLDALSKDEVSLAICLMGISIAIRWISGLYRGILNGFELQVWTSWFAVFIATLRYPLSILFIKYVDDTPIAYFSYQIAVSLLEYFLVSAKSKGLFSQHAYSNAKGSFENIKGLVRISLSISAVGIITTSITQVDKLSLSKILPLGEYGDFSLMSMLASGIVLLGGPFSSAVIPRMSKLVAEKNFGQLISTYKRISLLAGTVVFSAASFICFFAYEILYFWTGSADFSKEMSLSFALYAIANALFVVSSFPHYLQYAHGNLKLQIGISLSFLILFIPLSIGLSISYGVVGAASSWLALNLLMVLFGTALVHAKFMPNQHLSWLFKCVFPSLAFSLIACIFIDHVIIWSGEKMVLALQLAVVAVFVLAVSAIPSLKSMKKYFSGNAGHDKPDELVVLSKSVGFEVISGRKINTSSQSYEVGLIESISKNTNVRIEYIGEQKDECEMHIRDGLTFNGRGPLRISNSLMLIKYLAVNRFKKNLKVLTTGYYPVEMMLLNLARIIGIGSYSIVFDTHLAATEKMLSAKRVVSNVYFGIGFFLLRGLSGIVVLNDAFIKNKKFKVRTLLSKVGSDGKSENQVKRFRKRDCIPPVFLFAGTLNSDNGVDLIIDVLNKNKNLGAEFRFFGYGDKSAEIESIAGRDHRVRFMGAVIDDVLNEAIQDADYLICLRNPGSISCEYSFPSKLIKFMASGVPVIANEFPGLSDEYKNHLILTKYSDSGLVEIIEKLADSAESRSIGTNAAKYIQNTHDWNHLSSEMYEFIFQEKKALVTGRKLNAAA